MAEQNSRRIIEVKERIVGPTPPRPRTLRSRKPSDFPHVPASIVDVALRLSRPLMMGPPLCEELIALVSHVFTEEEASAARRLGLITGRSAAGVARTEHRPRDQIEPILDGLASGKRVLLASGPEGDRRYRLLPIVPGMFENVLVGQSPDSLSGWHYRFIELFEMLYETGYSAEYSSRSPPAVRYLPVGKSIEAQPMALPTDRLEDILDRFDTFAVGNCQCRIAMQALGRGCGKPLENCTAMGRWAEKAVDAGVFRKVSKKELLDIKREAESHGLVNWMMNIRHTHSQCSCSCCGCCCHAMRTVNEFSAPGLIAPPRFVPQHDLAKCDNCGKCARSCPMGGIIVELAGANKQKQSSNGYQRLAERCIGCGLCVLACDRQALTMVPSSKRSDSYHNLYTLIARSVPGMLYSSWRLHRQ